ncbi:MAG: YchJ family protein [Pseudomonadota bacterium]
MSKCPCQSDLDYSKCCEPLIKGEQKAETAEALMRSRYSAYVKNEINYIASTHHKSGRDEFDHDTADKWSKAAKWAGLEIRNREKGTKDDTEGKVEFIAKYYLEGKFQAHHEEAEFIKEEDVWYFKDGNMVVNEPVKREGEKVGRNDPCPCGSGKKFKKCCINK